MTKRLLYLNGLAILMIPLQHASAYGLQAMFEFLWIRFDPNAIIPNYSLLGSLPYHIITIFRQISTFSVPSFLFISGFFITFFAKGKNANVTWGQVLPRVKVLLYPFVIWTVFRFVMLRSFPKSLEEILQPYFFVPLLIQFYLISPWLVKMAKRQWKWLLILAATVHLGFQLTRYLYDLGVSFPGQLLIIQLSPRWLFYSQQSFWFPFGIVFGLHSKYFFESLKKYTGYLLFAMLFFIVATLVEYYVVFAINGEAWLGNIFDGSNFSGIIRNFYILSTLLYIVSLESISNPVQKRIEELGAKSLGIYMANIPSIYIVALFIFHFIPSMLELQLIYVSVLFMAGLGLPLLSMYIVRNSPFRSYYRYIFG